MRQKAIATIECFDERRFVRASFNDHLNARPDAVDIGGLAISNQTESEIMIPPSIVIFQEANARCRPVRDPKIEVAIEVPVEGRDRAGIIKKTEATGGGQIGKTPVAEVQEGRVAFVPTEAAILMQEAVERLPTLHVSINPNLGSGQGGLRHDLSPIDTSQVAGIGRSDETVGNDDVLQ